MFRPQLCDSLPSPLRRTCYSLATMPGAYFALRVTCVAAVLAIIAAGCQGSDKPRAKGGEAAAKQVPGGTELATARDAAGRTNQVNADKLQLVAGFYGPMPTGVTVSKQGRIFVNFPRWGDDVKFTVAELKDGKPVAFPDKDINNFTETTDPSNHLVSVQSVVVDDQDRLWILDTASINFTPVKENGPKLLCVDLKANKVVKTIHFKPDVALKTTYLNDIRFDLSRGAGGVAFITDSSGSGPNGIIVVDLDSGRAWRRLNDHPSTKAEPNFAPIVEGQPLMTREPGKPEAYVKIGSDGIALSPDKKTLYYCPLIGEHLYSVSADALADHNKSDQDVAATVKDLGDRGYASDGLECGPDGKLYLTDYEHNAIHVRDAGGGNDRVLVSDPRMIWPDTMSVRPGSNMLYFTANQLNRQKQFHNGKDLRKQPYALFRIPTDVRGGAPPTETASAAR